MRLLKQLEFSFDQCSRPALPGRLFSRERGDRGPWLQRTAASRRQRPGRDVELEVKARELLHANGAGRIAIGIRVEWNSRFKTAAGRAYFREKLISLNPRLCDYGEAEIDQTLRHEVAHVLAQFRAGRRRILPHGPEWRDACRQLGISDEVRCHNLPFPVSKRARRYLYRCPNCQRDFPRVQRVKRAVACLACCRVYNGGDFDARFRLQLVESA